MTDFKAKMHQIRFRLELSPRPRWASLQRSPDPLAGFRGAASRQEGEAELGKRRGRGREGEMEGREREGPKLLLKGPQSLATPLRDECMAVGFIQLLRRASRSSHNSDQDRGV